VIPLRGTKAGEEYHGYQIK